MNYRISVSFTKILCSFFSFMCSVRYNFFAMYGDNMKKKVLIIEDDPQNMQLFSEVVLLCGCEPVQAYSGEDGVSLARSCNPVLILMDILLPQMNGFEALKLIRLEQKNHLPVIAVTASAGRDEHNSIIGHGFDGFIPKPLDIEELRSHVAFYSAK